MADTAIERRLASANAALDNLKKRVQGNLARKSEAKLMQSVETAGIATVAGVGVHALEVKFGDKAKVFGVPASGVVAAAAAVGVIADLGGPKFQRPLLGIATGSLITFLNGVVDRNMGPSTSGWGDGDAVA